MRAPGDRDQLVDGGDGRRWVIREPALPTRKIRDVLRLSAAGMSRSAVGDPLGSRSSFSIQTTGRQMTAFDV
jgi:hypothetical protein